MVRNIWFVIGLVMAVIIFLSVVNFYIAIKPPKMGIKRDPSVLNLKYENISFKTSDGLTLRGWFIPSNYSKAVVIVGHGYPFRKDDVLVFGSFLHKYYNLLFFDFRYFGDSEGTYTTVGWKEQKDLQAAIDYLKSRKDIDSGKIGAIGFSLSAATMLMTKSDIKAIVADSPYASLDRMIAQSYRIFPGFTKLPFVWINKLLAKIIFGLDATEVSPEKTIKDLKVPVLLIHGDKDSQIPVENSKLLYEASDKNITELWIVPGADHGASHAMYPEKYEKKVLDFFEKNLLKKE